MKNNTKIKLDEFDELNEFSNEFAEEKESKTEDVNYTEEEENYNELYITVYNSKDKYTPIDEKTYKQIKKLGEINNFNNFFQNSENSIKVEDVKGEVKKTEEQEKKEEEKKERCNNLYVGFQKWAVDYLREGVNAKSNENKEKIRTATMGTIPETKHSKASGEKSALPKILMFISACIGTGTFLGIQANSFYIYKKGEVESNFSCAFAWLTVENMPTSTSPLYSDVFLPAFLVGFSILGVFGLFKWIDSDAKKQSRVGYEHGKTRIATKNDLKKFRRKFME